MKSSSLIFPEPPTPIRRLPPETLGEIFSLVVHTTFHFGDISEVIPPVTRNAPWLFTRVCRHWSAVALATPTLWSMIFVDLDRLGERGSVPLTNLCLQRSGNVPLTVKIFQERGTYDSHSVLDVALSASERWKTADLYIRFPLLHQITRIHGNLSTLTTVLISINMDSEEGFDEDFDELFWNVFADAPHLRSLQAICWDDSHFLRAPFSLPWCQLTRVSTTFASNTEALSVLRNLSEIIDCTFAFAKNEILPRNHSTIHLSSLRSLALQIENEVDDPPQLYQKHTSLLDFLETPFLQSLATHETADEEAVLGLITRSKCTSSLVSFRLYLSSIHHGTILHLVQKIPHLTLLEIGDFNGTLLPRSSVPVFVHAFANQWLGAAQNDVAQDTVPDHSRQILRVRIVDEQLEQQQAHGISLLLQTMQKDGLFITLSPFPPRPNIIFEDFHY
ncbi:F-box domain-containing protein [Mycena venus]|uniref:F-box domain-containing protein n=1 Tax=Mycena venus TaxID=2733690 RepID=A0A8H7CM91_9AGAR|nr:F-box domain-containing protein [Mycena venus]